jgi:hypothetical protein
MSLYKMALLAASMVIGLGLAGMGGVTHQAHAQGAQNTPANMLDDVGEEEAVYYNAKTGKVHKAKIKITAAHHTKAMAKGAKEVKAADVKAVKTSGMVYKHGGKIYYLENKPTTAGKTMMHEEFQDMFDVNQY